MISENKQRAIYVACDLLATALAWFVFNYIRYVSLNEEAFSSFSQFLSIRPVILGQIIFPFSMLVIYWLSGYYNKAYLKSRIEEFTTTLTTATAGTVLIYFMAILDDPIPDRATNYELLIMLFLMLFTIVYTVRLTVTGINNHRIASGKIYFNTLLISSIKDAASTKRRLETGINYMSHAFRVVGVVEMPDSSTTEDPSPQSEVEPGLPVIPMSAVDSFCKQNNIKSVVLFQPQEDAETLLALINRLLPLGLPILLSPTLVNVLTSKPRLNRLAADPLIDITAPNITESTVNLKRAGDFVVSLLAAIVLIPVYIAIAIAIKCDSKGPVIYSQTRIGLRRKAFKIYKFRTMVPDAEAAGPCLSKENDPRITHIGRILRKYRLDELPQFINVIAGNMSLVGPRPEREFYICQIQEIAPYYTLLHCVRPGITSLGMVKHGYASNINEMIQRMHYDLLYIENVSFTTDLKILAYTIATVLSGKGM